MFILQIFAGFEVGLYGMLILMFPVTLYIYIWRFNEGSLNTRYSDTANTYPHLGFETCYQLSGAQILKFWTMCAQRWDFTVLTWQLK